MGFCQNTPKIGAQKLPSMNPRVALLICSLFILSITLLRAQSPADCTFEHPAFSGMKAHFWENETSFQLVNSKRQVSLPLASADSLAYLQFLASNKKLKLSASEAFFISTALPVWEKERLKIGFEFFPNGLGIKILNKGEGAKPEEGQTVIVHYTGTLEDGTKFDSSVKRGTPFEFPLGTGRVIKGWDLGIAELPIGTKAILWIPADLGYGARGAGGVIPPGATLFFEVELLGVK
jgi:FKBP-type peptidyl-prolyl cis-trans isomerase